MARLTPRVEGSRRWDSHGFVAAGPVMPGSVTWCPLLSAHHKAAIRSCAGSCHIERASASDADGRVCSGVPATLRVNPRARRCRVAGPAFDRRGRALRLSTCAVGDRLTTVPSSTRTDRGMHGVPVARRGPSACAAREALPDSRSQSGTSVRREGCWCDGVGPVGGRRTGPRRASERRHRSTRRCESCTPRSCDRDSYAPTSSRRRTLHRSLPGTITLAAGVRRSIS